MTSVRAFSVPLFVPANRPERFAKAAASGADAIIIDLEDAVERDAKDRARSTVRTDFTDLPVFVRINSEGTPWYADDIAALSALPGLAGVIIPKADMDGTLPVLASNCNVSLLALVETARGISQARDIARVPGIQRLIFGSVDFSADLGCAHERDALLLARLELVMASRLAGLVAPIDGVTTSISNSAEIEADARYALQLGFSGKLAIHPQQILSIKSGLRPIASEIEWAEKVLASQDGATAIDGAMVDEPVRIRARSILARVAE